MKTTIDIPEKELKDAIRYTGAKTKKKAILIAVSDFNQRQRMAALARHLSTCKNLITPEELAIMREKD